MSKLNTNSPESVEERYQKAAEAERYYRHHGGEHGPSRRSIREIDFCNGVLRRFGPFQELLDCPSGVGRFWPMLRKHTSSLFAADVSAPMLEKARQVSGGDLLAGSYVAPAQHLPLPDGAVDAVFCHRLLHHFSDPVVRGDIFRELARVARRYVFFSAWSDRNPRSFRAALRAKRGHIGSRVHLPVQVLKSEATAAGFEILEVHYKFRFWSPLVLLVARKCT